MSSDNQTTPTTDSEAPAAAESSSSNSNAIDVHALKERIIATNKLFKYLSDAKNGNVSQADQAGQTWSTNTQWP